MFSSRDVGVMVNLMHVGEGWLVSEAQRRRPVHGAREWAVRVPVDATAVQERRYGRKVVCD